MNCRARIEWEVDLTKLPVRPLSPESRASFMAGNRFETTLPDAGNRVWFKILTGDDERKIPALQRAAPDRCSPTASSRSKASTRRTSAPSSKTSRCATPTSVDEFDRADCGVDTTIEVECPECREAQDVDLPFDSAFFLPGKERTSRRKARSASSPT